MDPEAMKPHGVALFDYYHGNKSAVVTFTREDGLKEDLAAAFFFRDPRQDELEGAALDLCRGHVLDIGAGAGIHSLYLQQHGFKVTSIDVSPEAAAIMRDRGVADVRELDVMSLNNEQFDTVLMMGHGIGLVETTDGLSAFLKHTLGLIRVHGQILLTSLDVRITTDSAHLQYQEKNTKSGRYFGEIRMRCEYGNIRGPIFGWLHIDGGTLGEYCRKAGWKCEIVTQKTDGNYLARLTTC